MFGRKGQDQAHAQREVSLRQSAVQARASAALEAAFCETADPASYVPRDASEHALRQLERCVSEPGRPPALQGAAGMGKTMLLRVLAQRLAGRRRCVFLAYGSLELADLCAWTLGIMRRPPASDPVEALLRVAGALHSQGTGLVLLIDDAGALPLETAGRLCEFQAGSSGALQLVLALPDSPTEGSPVGVAGAPARAALESLFDPVQLESPMTLGEMNNLLRTRLDRAGVPKVTQNRLDRAAVEALYAQSQGVPRLALRAGHRMLGELPSNISPSWHQDDDWPGAQPADSSPAKRDR